MISVGTEADVTGYQQVWEHFSQLSDSQDGWIVWDICRSASSILTEEGRGEKREKERGRGEREKISRGLGGTKRWPDYTYVIIYRTILSSGPIVNVYLFGFCWHSKNEHCL